jgi:hypothetical protein
MASKALIGLTIGLGLLLPTAAADHIAGMKVTQSGASGLSVTLRVELTMSNLPHGGTFEWSTGDGATGNVEDGVANGHYKGDDTGTGHLSDSRTFTWTRTQPVPSVVRTEITYSYTVDGTYQVEWSDCCPQVHGSTPVATGSPPLATPSIAVSKCAGPTDTETPAWLKPIANCFDTTASGAPLLKIAEWDGKIFDAHAKYQFGLTGECHTDSDFTGHSTTECTGGLVLQIKF